MKLPPLPRHSLILVDERSAAGEAGFLEVRRVTLRARFEGGEESAPFVYDIIDRKRLDAVVIAAHYRDGAGLRHVFLRSALRPPVALRPVEVRPYPEEPWLGALWELPAGLVEEDERSPAGLRACAARELMEELGFEVDPTHLRELGPSTFPAPGMVGERHYYFEVEVDPARRAAPTEDGSALERGALIFALPVDEAVDRCRRGEIEDAKTELALRRLAELGHAR
ncbi:MAG: NUDIX hydrolase [Byssovorax sp.]